MGEQRRVEDQRAVWISQTDIRLGNRGVERLHLGDCGYDLAKLTDQTRVGLRDGAIDGFGGRRPSRQLDEFADDAGIGAELDVLFLDKREVAVATRKIGVDPASIMDAR